MTSETPKIDDFDSYCLQIFALRAKVDTFGVDGSEFLIGFGPLQNPTPQIGYPHAFVHGVPQTPPVPSPRYEWHQDGGGTAPFLTCSLNACAAPLGPDITLFLLPPIGA